MNDECLLAGKTEIKSESKPGCHYEKFLTFFLQKL
jgi:hypothetical protein